MFFKHALSTYLLSGLLIPIAWLLANRKDFSESDFDFFVPAYFLVVLIGMLAFSPVLLIMFLALKVILKAELSNASKIFSWLFTLVFLAFAALLVAPWFLDSISVLHYDAFLHYFLPALAAVFVVALIRIKYFLRIMTAANSDRFDPAFEETYFKPKIIPGNNE